MAVLKIGELYLVEWEDAASSGAWVRVPFEFDETLCETVGWLLELSDKHVLLNGSRNDADQVGNLQYIPRSLIRKSRKLS